ncbi:hypothetical protein JNL27_15725 [bacterium]|nr:hypothetical protein [bacterium]
MKKRVILALIWFTLCPALFSQGLVIQQGYSNRKMSNKSFVILPIYDSISLQQPSYLLTNLYKYLPSELNKLSDNRFSYIDFDYREGGTLKKFLAGAWREGFEKETVTTVPIPKNGQTFNFPNDSADFVIIVYGIEFQRKSPKGLLYINAVVWDNKNGRYYANGRFKIESAVSEYDVPDDVAQDFMRKFAYSMVNNNPLSKGDISNYVDQKDLFNKPLFGSNKPFFTVLRFSSMKERHTTFSVSNIIGFSSSNIRLGLGIGYDFVEMKIDGKTRSVSNIPIFIHSRIKPESAASMYLFSEAGYSIQSIKHYQSNGGGMVSAGFGIGSKYDISVLVKHYMVNLLGRSDKSKTTLQIGVGFLID